MSALLHFTMSSEEIKDDTEMEVGNEDNLESQDKTDELSEEKKSENTIASDEFVTISTCGETSEDEIPVNKSTEDQEPVEENSMTTTKTGEALGEKSSATTTKEGDVPEEGDVSKTTVTDPVTIEDEAPGEENPVVMDVDDPADSITQSKVHPKVDDPKQNSIYYI